MTFTSPPDSPADPARDGGDARHGRTSHARRTSLRLPCETSRVKRTVGVEEEFLLVGDDGRPVARAAEALEASGTDDKGGGTGSLESEFMEEQLETATHPRRELDELAAEIREGRRRAQDAADRVGARVAALSTSPLPFEGTTVSRLRYLEARAAFGLTAREQLTSGCHVHVAVADDTEGVAVLDRIGPWLSTLLALSTNSPFWQGQDSGYASFRSQVWSRWPTSGPTRAFGSPRRTGRRSTGSSRPARSSTRTWCTSTPGCPRATRPSRSASPTCASTPTPRRSSQPSAGASSRRRHARPRTAPRPRSSAPRSCGPRRGAPGAQGSRRTWSRRSRGAPPRRTTSSGSWSRTCGTRSSTRATSTP
ncbi:carboxylate-amine ligase [Cellulosimicrobium cellulans]|uniref:carboxylate-amine ligase n=1 Tax=Cellulosimicrobium cellulans TaxID=1710 RepID=UPI002ED6D11D